MSGRNGAGRADRGCAITVVVPVHNEGPRIAEALHTLAAQDIGPAALEVIVMDGGSTDATWAICERLGTEYPWGRFVVRRNAGHTAPFALNAGLRDASCPWFTRLDARTRMSKNYLSSCLEYLEASGDPMRAASGLFVTADRGEATSVAIASALSHPIGVGNGYRTIADDETEIDHHPFAVWPTDVVRKVGGFDEELTRNQDDEFSNRARAAGARIFMVGRASITYRPRERFRGLAAQYFQYGLWKSAVGRSRGYFPKRSVVPAGLTLLTLGMPVLLRRGRFSPLLGVVGTYTAFGAAASRRRGRRYMLLTGWALFVMHFFYGLGVLLGGIRPSLARGPLGRLRIM